MRFPVLKAFAATFAYLSKHWLLLLQAMWLPALIAAALQLYAAPGLFNALAEFALLGPNPDSEKTAAAVSRLGGAMIYVLVAGLIFFPMLTVASLKHVVRGEAPRLPFHFAFGADETRVMAANFLFTLMVAVIAVVGDVIVNVFAAVVGLAGAAIAAALKSVGSFIVQLIGWWFQARLSPLMPAVMETKTLGLAHAFEATRRDWPGVIAFWILIGLVLAPAMALLFAPIAAPFVGDLAGFQNNDPAAAAALFQKIAAALAPTAPGFWYAAAAVIVSTLVANAIVNVASAVVWRYLTAPPEREERAP